MFWGNYLSPVSKIRGNRCAIYRAHFIRKSIRKRFLSHMMELLLIKGRRRPPTPGGWRDPSEGSTSMFQQNQTIIKNQVLTWSRDLTNGVGGIPTQTAGNHSGFRSPLQFNPATGRWIFHSNTTNPDYVRRVVGAGMISNARE